MTVESEEQTRLLDHLMLSGFAWDEACQIVRGEPFVVTVGGETFPWLPSFSSTRLALVSSG